MGDFVKIVSLMKSLISVQSGLIPLTHWHLSEYYRQDKATEQLYDEKKKNEPDPAVIIDCVPLSIMIRLSIPL